MTIALEVIDLKYQVNDYLNLEIDRFELRTNQFHALLGANGAGKSTFNSLISGQLNAPQYQWRHRLRKEQ